MKLLFLISIFLISCTKNIFGKQSTDNSNEHLYLYCEIKGAEAYSGDNSKKFSDKISVEIKSDPFSTEIISSGGENASFSILGYKNHNENSGWDKSNENQWELGNTSKDYTISNYILINRNTGIISYQRSVLSLNITFSGICTKAETKKF